MRKNILSISMVAASIAISAQTPLFHLDNNALVYVNEQALIYNGGTVQTQGNAIYDVHGNVMIVGSTDNKFRTLDNSGTGEKTTGGNFILRLNDPGNYDSSSYGQLFINGIPQNNITAIIDKEFRSAKHGKTNYFQQIALPFYGKTLNSLSAELGKTFTTQRWSQNEILKYNNLNVVSEHYTDLSQKTIDPTGYYMLGSKNNDFDSSNPNMGTTYTLKGIPYADNIKVTLQNAGRDINFGNGGNALNQYTEPYNTYLQDKFDFSSGAWQNNYGKNLYQFGNPFLTNIDLSKIGYVEKAKVGDDNQITTIQGIRYDPGTIATLPNGSTYSTGALIQTFVTKPGRTQGTPVGDIGLVIKPMQPFVIKLTKAADTTFDPLLNVLNFDNLRRFNSSTRGENINYSVTANKNGNPGDNNSTEMVKQLCVKALDSEGKEIGRTYYVVYPQAVSGYTNTPTTQATNSSTNLIGTFEEDAITGGYDYNLTSSYWLYINEANELDFQGKAIPMALYSNEIKFLQFEVKENTQLIGDSLHNLSSGIGFYYNASGDSVSPVKQNQTIPVTSSSYSVYYGKPSGGVLGGTGTITSKPSRTMVLYSPSINDYVVRFDPDWKYATIQVIDMSGRVISSNANVRADSDHPLKITKVNSAYIVKVISSKGEVVQSKILR